jgi:hypothetical protein
LASHRRRPLIICSSIRSFMNVSSIIIHTFMAWENKKREGVFWATPVE